MSPSETRIRKYVNLKSDVNEAMCVHGLSVDMTKEKISNIKQRYGELYNEYQNQLSAKQNGQVNTTHRNYVQPIPTKIGPIWNI